MIAIYNDSGEVIGTSRNLRGIHERNQRFRASHVEVSARPGCGAELLVKWPDGSWARALFASFGVCVDHANTRRFATAAKNIHQTA